MFTNHSLLETLVEICKDIFRKERFPDSQKKGNLTSLNIYQQSIPVLNSQQYNETQEELESGLLNDVSDIIPFPYLIVDLNEGSFSVENSPGKTSVSIWIGIYDDGKLRNGGLYVLHAIQKIGEYFQKNPAFAGYEVLNTIKWVTDNEENYYFGVVSMDVKIPGIEREESDSLC